MNTNECSHLDNIIPEKNKHIRFLGDVWEDSTNMQM